MPRDPLRITSAAAAFAVSLACIHCTRAPKPSQASLPDAPAASSAAPPVPAPSSAPSGAASSAYLVIPSPADVTIPSGALRLRGYLVRPRGEGPFPVVVYNHGSEKTVDIGFYLELAAWWQSRGFAILFPLRRGVGASEGKFWRDEVGDVETEAGARAAVARLDLDNDDVVAALAWAAAQPFVDAKRIVVAGCSFGGIQALLTAARTTQARAALDFAGGSITWSKWPSLQERMHLAARDAKVPVFFLQAQNDFDTTPSRVLADDMEAAGKPHQVSIFPPHGQTKMAGHGGFCLRGMAAWGDDVLRFVNDAFEARPR